MKQTAQNCLKQIKRGWKTRKSHTTLYWCGQVIKIIIIKKAPLHGRGQNNTKRCFQRLYNILLATLAQYQGPNGSSIKKLDSCGNTEREHSTVHATLSTHFIFFLFFVFFSLEYMFIFYFFGTHFNIEQAKGRTEKPCSLTRLSYCCFKDCFRDYVWMKVWWMTSGKKVDTLHQRQTFSGSEMKMSLSVCVAFKQSLCDGFDAFLRHFGESYFRGAEILT